jgi:hypothetical protein
LGSSGIWPLQKRNLPLRTACEYGPIAAGASFVETIFFMSPIVTANLADTMRAGVVHLNDHVLANSFRVERWALDVERWAFSA